MTTLSYLLLLAPAAEGLRIACGLMAGILALGGVLYIVYMCGGFNSYNNDDPPAGTSKKWPVIAFTLTIVFALMAAIMPDRKTVYMVAGVETINRFSQTEVAKELGDSGMSIVRDITTMIHTYTMDAVRESKEKNGDKDDRQ